MCVLPLVLAIALADQAAVAEALFREGKRLMKDGNFKEACPKLAESHRIDPALGTLLNLAACHAAEGRTATAWAEYSDAAAKAAHAGRAEYEEVARAQIAELTPKLSRLRIVANETVRVTLDGEPLGAGVLGTAIPVDPGSHAVTAHAAERTDWKMTVAISEPGTREIVIPPLVPIAVPVVVSPPPPPSRTWFYTFGAATIVSAGVGSYFGMRAFSLNHDAEQRCPSGVCRDDGLELDRRARTSATVSTIAFGVAVAGVVATVIAYSRSAPVMVGLHGVTVRF